MTEVEWLACNDPAAMLRYLSPDPDIPGLLGVDLDSALQRSLNPHPSARRLRLFGCACVRQLWNLLHDARLRRAVEMVERLVDLRDARTPRVERAISGTSHAALQAIAEIRGPVGVSPVGNRPYYLATAVHWLLDETSRPFLAAEQICCFTAPECAAETQAALLRDIVGNPWRPLPECWWCRGDGQASHDEDKGPCTVCRGTGHALPRSVAAWNNGIVPKLAQAAYGSRDRRCGQCEGRGRVRILPIATESERPCPDCHGTGRVEGGTLDPARLPVLADALEEAGCTEASILEHLRGPGPHARGCWVVDLILGKE